MEMYKKLLLATMIAGLVGCGGSESTTTSSTGTGGTETGDTETGDTVTQETTSFELYYKDAALSGTLNGSTFVAYTDGSVYSTFSIDASGNWTYTVPIADNGLGDMESDETQVEYYDVTINGEVVTLTFTIKSADAKPDDENGTGTEEPEDSEEVDPTFACETPTSVESSDSNPVKTGTTYTIDTDDLTTTLANAVGGDEIIITGGDSISFKDVCFDSPVIIRAATVGSIALETASITRSQNIILQGFEFGPNDNSTLLKIVDSKNIKILRNKFDHMDVTEGQTSLVLTGASETITIAYNEFLDKNVITEEATGDFDSDGEPYYSINSGSYIKFQYDDELNTMTKEAHIHHNYFKNIAPYVKTGNTTPEGDSDREAIVFGDSGSQDVETNHLIEYNLFEDCDGENEIMTVKTSNNEFSNNTFLNSMGSLSFRLGHDNKAIDNYFYGTGASDSVEDANYETGGIRVYGANHIVTGNYITGLSGTSWRSPILIDSGDVSDSSNGNSHEAPTNVTVSDNTLVDNLGGGIYIGRDNYSIVPTGITISDNVVTGSEGVLFDNYADSLTNTWSGNQSYATGSALDTSGGALNSSELEILTAEPTIVAPTPLTTSDVGPSANTAS
ncbi:VCBS domain-containing protein [Psychromonas sp.]|nr:VCBS domain-containing protein [Psychromonas sp.]